jgi:phage gp29-like protein
MTQHMATRVRAGDMSGMLGILPNPDPILRRTGRAVQVYRELMVDTMVKSGARRRRAAVVSMESGFDRETRAPRRVVTNLESIFADLPLRRLVRNLVDGALYGYAVAEVIWGRVGNLVVPVDVVAKPQEWFGFNAENDLVLREMASLNGTPVPQRKFILVGNETSYINPYGEADLASCFWPVAFRKGGIKFWVTFAEKYGMPWAVGKQPRSASQKETDDLADKLESMVRDAVAVIPNDASIELHTANTTASADMYEQLLMYCSREINIALLGNNQSTEMQSNKASATAAAGVEDELRDADAEMVADGLSTLARWICEVNWPSSMAPAYEFWQQEEVDETQAKRDEILTRAGVKFTRTYWQRTYNLQDDDIEDQPDTAPIDSGVPVVELAEGSVPPDQAALDAAVADMPAAELARAMEAMLRPAVAAVQAAKSPDEAMSALAEAFPTMDSRSLETLLERAFFVADVVGRQGVVDEAGGNDQAGAA